jgi:hypothetical protein
MAISSGMEMYVGAATATEVAGAGVCAVAAPARTVTASAQLADVLLNLRIHSSRPHNRVTIRARIVTTSAVFN